MRTAIRFGLALALTGAVAPSAWAQRALFQFLDVTRVEREEIEFREEAWDPPPMKEGETFLSTEQAPPSPDPSLARPLARLRLDAEGFRKLPSAPAGREIRVALPLVDFTVAGYLVRMAVIEVKTDTDFDAQHYTLLATDSNAFARLTVALDGPEIVGTVFIGDREFRILPERDDYQLVYPVVAHNRAWRRDNPADLESRTGLLEARHLQIGWVADRLPGSFDTHDDGRPHTYAEGPSLGKLNFWSALEFDPAGNGTLDEVILETEVETYLNDLPYFTWIDDRIDVRIDRIDSLDLNTLNVNGATVQSSQLLFGIAISQPLNLRMAPSGDVTAFDGTLVREDMAPPYDGERILADEARATSASALLEAHGLEAVDEIVSQELFYQVRGSDELELIWRIQRTAECGMVFQIDVDAISGRALRVNLVDDAGLRDRSAQDGIFQCRFFRFRQR